MDKVILITGAGKGIGRAATLAFLEAGARVLACSRTKEDLDQLKKDAPNANGLCTWTADLTQDDAIEPLVKETQHQFGRIDGLINNAGILTPKNPIPKIKTEDWDATFAINLRAPFLLMKQILPIMIKNKNGTIINISSGASRGPSPLWGAYGISKLALEGLTQCAQAEIENKAIRIIAVDPGGTRTRMRAQAYPNEDPNTLPTPADVATLFIWLFKNEGFDPDNKVVSYREWAKTHS